MKNDTKDSLIRHYLKYKQMEIPDIFKYLYQSTFGCEHMVSSLPAAIEYIKKEAEALGPRSVERKIEPLDGKYSRVDLSVLNDGLSAETIGQIFVASAEKEKLDKSELEAKIEVVRELIRENILSFTQEEFELSVNEWSKAGYPPVHHSEPFRKFYHPAYRVIYNEYVNLLPVFIEIDKALAEDNVLLADKIKMRYSGEELKIIDEIYDK